MELSAKHLTSFTYDERILITVVLNHKLAELEQAMVEDQGCKEGKPGTLGHTQRLEYLSILNKIKVL